VCAARKADAAAAAVDTVAQAPAPAQTPSAIMPKPARGQPVHATAAAGSHALSKPQRDQIQRCIQVLVKAKPGRQRPAWPDKMAQLRQMEDGEALALEYEEVFSQLLAGVGKVLVSLIETAELSPAPAEDWASGGGTASAGGAERIVIEGSDSPSLQQFIDRVNAALRERDEARDAAPEPETFCDLCVLLGIEEKHNYLVSQMVDSKERLLQLASHGLKTSDCAEIGLDEKQRDNIMAWAHARRSAVGLMVFAVSIERQALWHPIVYNTQGNLPRDLRQLLHEATELGTR
jgi:hypothetical protein